MHSATPDHTSLQSKVRRLTATCLLVWFGVTLAPVWAASHPGWQLWGWPLDFWMAAQGCVLIYLALVSYFAWQVNRWERLAGTSSIAIPSGQDT
jgi:putative solute:sodium symporter small subunit